MRIGFGSIGPRPGSGWEPVMHGPRVGRRDTPRLGVPRLGGGGRATPDVRSADPSGAVAAGAVVSGPRVRVTTSWDDGHVFDHHLADLLREYQVAGTFYPAPESVEFPPRALLGPAGIRELAHGFEIGAHTWSHVRLSELPDERVRAELRRSRDELEQTVGRAVTSFCYPGGDLAERHPSMVREAGFTYARTVERDRTGVEDPMRAPTTVHARSYRRDLLPLRKQVLSRVGPSLSSPTPAGMWRWDDVAIWWFDEVLRTGGDFHLWGHSWELEDGRGWDGLRRVLDHISRRPGVDYVENRALAAEV